MERTGCRCERWWGTASSARSPPGFHSRTLLRAPRATVAGGIKSDLSESNGNFTCSSRSLALVFSVGRARIIHPKETPWPREHWTQSTSQAVTDLVGGRWPWLRVMEELYLHLNRGKSF